MRDDMHNLAEVGEAPSIVPKQDLPKQDLQTRLERRSAHDIEDTLRQVVEWRPLPTNIKDALLTAAELCADVRRHLARTKVGEKGLGQTDNTKIGIIVARSPDNEPIVEVISGAFRAPNETTQKLLPGADEVIVLENRNGSCRITRRPRW